jgi:hypothetical protein
VGHEDAANWPGLPIGAWRSWDVFTISASCPNGRNVTWQVIGSGDNNYCWTTLDIWVSYITSKGLDIDYVIGKTPSYAAPVAAAPPNDLLSGDTYFKNFVSALTTRYNGLNGHGFIKYYEIWNEPNASTFWTGTHQQLASMVKDASAIIRSNSPTSLIIAPASQGYSSYQYLDSLLADGIAPYVDIIGYHNYLGSRGNLPTSGQPATTGPEYTTSLINSYKATLTKYNVSLPIWNTEFSFGCVYLPGTSGGGNTAPCPATETSFLPDRGAEASWLARTYIIQASMGIGRSYWYGWDFSPYGTQWESSGDLIGVWPSGYAYQNLQTWLVGKTFVSDCAPTTQGDFYNCSLVDSSGTPEQITWSTLATCNVTPCSVTVPTNFTHYQVLSITATADTPSPINSQTVSMTSNLPVLLTHE